MWSVYGALKPVRKANLLLLLTCTVLLIIYFKNFVYRNLKDAVHGQLASQAEDSITRLSECIGTLMEMQYNFDDGLSTTKPLLDYHVKPKTMEDIKLVVSELVSQCVFWTLDDRKHRCFHHFKPLLHKINKDTLAAWINKTVQHILQDQ